MEADGLTNLRSCLCEADASKHAGNAGRQTDAPINERSIRSSRPEPGDRPVVKISYGEIHNQGHRVRPFRTGESTEILTGTLNFLFVERPRQVITGSRAAEWARHAFVTDRGCQLAVRKRL